ncbi:MAG: glycogen/starch/alpha-glucan phosphorylase [Opitutales bacterium]
MQTKETLPAGGDSLTVADSPADLETEVEEFKSSILRHLRLTLARHLRNATRHEVWMSTSLAVRDHVVDRYISTQKTHNEQDVRRVYYLSLEYLMGRLLTTNLYNSGLRETAAAALAQLGYDLEDVSQAEHDMGLGNGGLGRLAACFLDSLATLDLPAIGYGIHYQFGLFRQVFENGRQVEKPDDWLKYGNPWEIVRPQYAQTVRLYGRVEPAFDTFGNYAPRWVNTKSIEGIPYDLPIVGYGTRTVNFLRLWESKASQEFDLDTFNEGGYVEAVREKAVGETISKVLYPNDQTESGKELRLVQQYFFVVCSLRDIIRRYRKRHDSWDEFADKVVIQLNDTHPSVAILELMRILVDEERFKWDFSWDVTRRTFAYTNHTLLPEALETWNEELFRKVLPRHLEIVHEINRRFLRDEVELKWPQDSEKKRALSLVSEGDPKHLRMAHLAVVGGHSVNGVAALHTELLKRRLFPDFSSLYPNKFNNKTNGITPRRWLLGCNPALSDLITRTIGDSWPKDLECLRELDAFAEDVSFQEDFMRVKRVNKERLCSYVSASLGMKLNPDAIFDSQIKRLHEYKRQHLNLMHVLTLYRRLLQDPHLETHPRVFFFGAKAAPGYELAKTIIRAVNLVGKRINEDLRIGDRLKVVFLPNYGVSVAEMVIPGTDLSEQISTAGKEASGTGNMKFALNGAITIGTLDGANIEIREEVGDDNIFIFGNTFEEIEELRQTGYDPKSIYETNEEAKAVLDWLSSDFFTPGEGAALQDVSRSILEWGDPYFLLADYDSYCSAHQKAEEAYVNRSKWAAMAIRNVARCGRFSSDRTIREYARDIWFLDSVPVVE